MNTLFHHVVISPVAGSMIVLNGAANRDPFELNISFFEQVLIGPDTFLDNFPDFPGSFPDFPDNFLAFLTLFVAFLTFSSLSLVFSGLS